jgi:hypothetical protein
VYHILPSVCLSTCPCPCVTDKSISRIFKKYSNSLQKAAKQTALRRSHTFCPRLQHFPL